VFVLKIISLRSLTLTVRSLSHHDDHHHHRQQQQPQAQRKPQRTHNKEKHKFIKNHNIQCQFTRPLRFIKSTTAAVAAICVK